MPDSKMDFPTTELRSRCLENQSKTIYINNKEPDEYRTIDYEVYDIVVPMENKKLNRNNSSIRGDREMDYAMMIDKINFYNNQLKVIKDRIYYRLSRELSTEIDSIYSVTFNFLTKKTEIKLTEELISIDSIKTEIKLSKDEILKSIHHFDNTAPDFLNEHHISSFSLSKNIDIYMLRKNFK